MGKPILCLDFDGVIHSYKSGWKGADVILDKPVPGALDFMKRAHEHFDIQIYSSRSNEAGGIVAMQLWLSVHLEAEGLMGPWAHEIKFPTRKPPAKVTIDDRAITFTGVWPELDALIKFKPWNM